jgi:putative oxidoreductase
MQRPWYYITAPASPTIMHIALCCMRVSIGLLTIGHGIPKIMGGTATWQSIGAAISVIGIYFWPTFWGFLAACTEVFGGFALILGWGTRLASFLLASMMIIAFLMHWQKGDSFIVYSYPLSMFIIFINFMIIGGGALSIDALTHKK